jgi:hypothetical protein
MARDHTPFSMASLCLRCFGRWRFGLADLNQPSFMPCSPTVMCAAVFSEPPNSQADRDRGSGYVPKLYDPCQAEVLEPVQSAANGASTLRAIRIATENAGLDSSQQISRIVRGHSGKCTLRRIRRRHTDGLRNAFIRQEFRIPFAQRWQFLCHSARR